MARYYHIAETTGILRNKESEEILNSFDLSSVVITHVNLDHSGKVTRENVVIEMIRVLLNMSDNEKIIKMIKKGEIVFNTEDLDIENVSYSIIFPAHIIEGNISISKQSIQAIRAISI